MKRLFLVLSLLFALLGSAFAAVNVNTATKEELDSLAGIGPVKAQAIVDYRTKNGPFKSVDDLKNVKGIGPKTLEDIRKDVSISGPSAAIKPTAPAKAEPAKPAAAAAPAKAMEAPKADTTKSKSDKKAEAETAKADKKTEADKAKADKKEAAKSAKAETKDAAEGATPDKKVDAKPERK